MFGAPDLHDAAGTYFGTSMRRTFDEMAAAGQLTDADRFLEIFLKAFRGEDTGIPFATAELQLRQALGLVAPPPVEPMDAEKENAWVAEKIALPRTELLPGGVVLQRLVEGSGAQPGPHSNLRVMYSGRLSSGAEFDKTTEPFLMPVDRVVPGLAAALQQMRQGGTYRVFIPPAMGYAEEAVMDLIPGNSALDFTITIEEIL